MLKKIKILFVSGCMIFGLILTLNGSPSSVYAAEKVSQPIRIKCSNHAPPGHYIHKPFTDIFRELEQASEGKVIIEYYHSATLGKSTEQWDIVAEGLADMSVSVGIIFYPARFLLSSFLELPFIYTNTEAGSRLVQELIKRKPILNEFEGVKFLTGHITPPAQLFSNRVLSKVDDFKGMRIVGQGPVWTKTWSLLGAQSVAMEWPDIYLGLERKTIDATPGNWAGSKSWKWAEVAKYPTEISIMGGFFMATIMNSNTWNKIPPNVQAAWSKILEGVPMRIAKVADENEDVGRKFARDVGREIYTFPAAEKEKLGEKLLPIWQDWLNRNESAGKPAKEIYKTYVEVMKKAGEPVVMKIPGLY